MPPVDANLMIFGVLAGLAAMTAVGVVAFSNAVRSALCLVLNFFTLAFLYFTLRAELLGITQIIVYTGAIMVLFLFVIMLLGGEALKAEFDWRKLAPAIILAVLLIAQILVLVVQKVSAPELVVATSVADASPVPLANQLFTVYLLPFEVTSILLLVAMVGAIILTKKTGASAANKKGAQG